MVKWCLVVVMAAAGVVGCGEPTFESTATSGSEERARALPGFRTAMSGVFVGGEPQGDEAFDELAGLGVKTIVSVDGITPDLEQARARGMRVVHVPIGYGELAEHDLAQLTRAMREAEWPIYVHCHHGLHRGPTAAVVGLIGCGKMTNDDAVAFMERAGTSSTYEGLWASARSMVEMSAEDAARLGGELVERAEVNSFAHGMAVLDRAVTNLEELRRARWDGAAHPDLVPAKEAAVIAEAFRAMGESDEMAEMDILFGKKMAYTLGVAQALEEAMTREPFDTSAVEHELDRLDGTCTDCHSVYRE